MLDAFAWSVMVCLHASLLVALCIGASLVLGMAVDSVTGIRPCERVRERGLRGRLGFVSKTRVDAECTSCEGCRWRGIYRKETK